MGEKIILVSCGDCESCMKKDYKKCSSLEELVEYNLKDSEPKPKFVPPPPLIRM